MERWPAIVLYADFDSPLLYLRIGIPVVTHRNEPLYSQ